MKSRDRSVVCDRNCSYLRTLISLHCGVDNKFWWRIGRFDWTRNNWWAKEDSSGICILGWIWSTTLDIIAIFTMEQGILTTNNKNFDIKIFAVWKKFSNKKQIQILAWNYFWSKKKKREKRKNLFQGDELTGAIIGRIICTSESWDGEVVDSKESL